jgi:hypothetical protein
MQKRVMVMVTAIVMMLAMILVMVAAHEKCTNLSQIKLQLILKPKPVVSSYI